MSMATYPGDGDRVTMPATKPVSGEAIVSSLDRMESITGHGTKQGYDGIRPRVFVMPKLSKRDTRALNTWADGETTVADSFEDFDDDETEPAPGIDAVAAPSLSAPLAGSVPPGPVSASGGRTAKWAVRRVWVAVAPDGAMHGPFADQSEAVAFVGTKLPKPVRPVREKGTRRRITEEERATFRRLHAEGVSTTKIGQQTGRAISVVARELLSMGLQSNGHRFGAKHS